jgi:hypothetical protein
MTRAIETFVVAAFAIASLMSVANAHKRVVDQLAGESTMNKRLILLRLPRSKPMRRHTMPPSKVCRTNLTILGRGRANSPSP